MIDLIFSIDYELFGNGSGEVLRDIVEPTDRLLEICERHGAKLTIMAEVAEYWAFRDADARLQHDLGYSPADAVEKQLKRAVTLGHDVQLHLHPQWIGARYRNGLWQLKFHQRTLADLPAATGAAPDASAAVAVLRQGKQTLDSLLQPIDSSYECVAFRAGGFCVPRDGELIDALRCAGLWADSSVVPGHFSDSPCLIDFRDAPGRCGCWWTTPSKLTEQGGPEGGIVELPVHAVMKPYTTNFKFAKLRATMKRRAKERSDPHSRVTDAPKSSPSVATVLRKLLSKHAMKLDICKLSAGDMLAMCASAAGERQMGTQDLPHPLVCLGHSKDFWNDAALDRFLRTMANDPKLRSEFRWNTLGGVVRQIVSKLPTQQRQPQQGSLGHGCENAVPATEGE